MPVKNLHSMDDEEIRRLIFVQLGDKTDLRRKALIESCILSLGYTEEQLGDHSTGSEVILAKSRIGTVLSAAMRSGYILEDDIGFLHLNPEEIHYISKDRGKDFVVSALEQNGPLTKQQIFRLAEKAFGTDKTPDNKDDMDLRSVLGKVIVRLEQEKHISITNGKICLTHDSAYPNTELGSYLREASLGGDLEKCFLRAVHTKGGEWFEAYCVDLLTKYFLSCGKEILSASVTGGSNDGGIDGDISTSDWLGYRERILMQMKNRNAIITTKDVREFYGAVCAEKGTRGVFITISQFHYEAQRLLDSVDNLIGIDGHRLFEIAAKCGHGLVTEAGRLKIDEAMLLNT